VVGVAPEAAAGGGINGVKVTMYQLGEGSFRTGVGVKTEEFGICGHGSLLKRHRTENRTKK
jgi:hypothetical protein